MKLKLLIAGLLISFFAQAQAPSGYVPRYTKEYVLGHISGNTHHIPSGAAPTLNGGWPGSTALYGDTVGGGRGFHYYMLGSWKRVVDSSELADTAAALRSSLESSNTSLGTGYKVAVDATNNIKSLKEKYGITLDSATSGEVGIKADTATLFPAVRSTIPSSGSAFTFKDSLQWLWAANYGVVFDGITDNATALNNLAAAQRSNPNRIVAFGPGIVYSSDSVTWNNATLRGYGTIIKTTSTTVTIFNIQDSCEVSGFKFIGTGIAASLPGGVFTTQDGIRIFGNKNRVHDNWFSSLNGSGVNVWAGSCCGYRNSVYDNVFYSNTIGIFAMTNSEYLDAYGNKGELNYVGIYDRSSSNNRWWGNEFSYSVHSNFRLLGNGDHGGAWNNTFNHGNSFNVYIESCTLNYDFGDNICYTGNIAFGSVGVVNNFNWHGGTISGATITQTGSNVSNVYMHDFIEGSTANTYSATGIIYENILNNTTMPRIVGGALAGSSVVIKSTEGAGTATGVGVSMIGGTDGATTLWQIANNGNIGSGFAPTSGFKQIIKSLGSGAGTTHTLWRNSLDQALIQVDDAGNVKIGNQATTSSFNNLVNRNFVGDGTTTPTAYLHIKAESTGVQTGPIKFTVPSNLMTSAESQVFGPATSGDKLLYTIATGTARKGLIMDDGTDLTAGRIPFATTSGRLTDASNFTFTGQALQLSSTNTTENSGSSGFAQTYNSLTSGTGEFISSSSMTIGNLLNLVSTSTAANGFNLASLSSSGVNANSGRTANGATISVTNTGTSSTNNGLIVTASGATNNYAILATPNIIIGSPSTNTNDALLIQNRSNGNFDGITIYPSGFGTKMTYGTAGIQRADSFTIKTGAGSISLNPATGVFVGSDYGTATALMHIKASTATANTGQIKLNEGTRQTTPENGTINYISDNLEFTETSTVYILAKTLKATASLDFVSTGTGLSSELTINVPGAVTGDPVALAAPHSLAAATGVVYTAWVSSSDTVSVKFGNYSGGTLDPASGSFTVSVIHY